MRGEAFYIRGSDGAELGVFSEREVCALIEAGTVMLDALASRHPTVDFLPITQFPVFARAFAARLGISVGSPRGSEITPMSTPSGATPGGTTPGGTTPGGTTPSVGPVPADVLTPSTTLPSVEAPDTPIDLPAVMPDDEISHVSTGDRTHPGMASPVPLEGLEADATWVDPRASKALGQQGGAGSTSRSPAMGSEEPGGPLAGGEEREPSSFAAPGADAEGELEAPGLHRDPSEDPSDPEDLGTPTAISALSDSGAPLPPPQIASPEPRPVPEPRAPSRAPNQAPSRAPSRAPSQAPSRAPSRLSVSDGQARGFVLVTVGLAAWALFFAALYTTSVALGGGVAEAGRSWTSGVFWLRVLGLGGGALLLLRAFPSDLPLRRADFALPLPWTLAAMAAGGLLGLFVPALPPVIPLAAALLSGLLQAAAEELFFRAYLARALESVFGQIGWPTAIGALLYGVYFATHHAVWANGSALEVVLRVSMITLGAGVAYGLFYYLTRSFAVAFLCHAAAAATTILAAS